MNAEMKIEEKSMGFHRIYVGFLNPLSILILGSISAVYLIILLKGNILFGDGSFFGGNAIPSLGQLSPGTLLWVMFALVAFSFLFILVAEILLVKRRRAGLTMLMFAYLFHIASATLTLIKYQSSGQIYSYISVVVVSILIMVYYWKRREMFT